MIALIHHNCVVVADDHVVVILLIITSVHNWKRKQTTTTTKPKNKTGKPRLQTVSSMLYVPVDIFFFNVYSKTVKFR